MSADFLMQFTENCYNGEEQVRDALKAKHKFTEEISGDTFRPSPGRTPMCASRNSRVMMIPEWWCSSSHLSVATRCTMRSGGRRRPPRPESPTQWLPDRQQVGVVEGDFAVVSLALACVKSQVAMVSRRRWDTALYHPPSPQPPGKRGPKPLKGKRQHRLQAWAERADTPWEIVEVDWYGDHRKQLWGFSFTALWHTRGCPRSTSALYWWVTQRGSCAWQRSAAPTCRPPRCKSWSGWSYAGSLRSPVKGAVRISAWNPTPMVGPSHGADHPSPVGSVLARHPAGLAVESRWPAPGASDRLVSQS